jgi:hypothetical protein
MSAEKIAERQQRYERLPTTGQGRMFKIVEVATDESRRPFDQCAAEGAVRIAWPMRRAAAGAEVAARHGDIVLHPHAPRIRDVPRFGPREDWAIVGS